MAMPAAVPADDTPAGRAQTPEGTLIMPTVPGQRPERAGGARAAGGQIPDEHTSNQQRSSRR